MKIFKISSLKNKIQQFKLTDPFIIFFISKYERLIPWENIKNQDDINIYVKNVLVPAIKEKISQSEVASAEKWTSLMSSYNNPFFEYVVLAGISSPLDSKDNKELMPASPAVVKGIYNEIKDQNGRSNFHVYKKYLKDFNEMQSSRLGAEENNNESGKWLRIPSKKNDPENYEQNIEALTAYSKPNGWCTGEGRARPYLSKGDFHLYIKNGKAEVAIRMEKGELAEIQGERNKRPYGYADEIEEYLKSQGISAETNAHFQELMEVKKRNAEILQDPSSFIEKIKSQDFFYDISKWINALSDEILNNKELFAKISEEVLNKAAINFQSFLSSISRDMVLKIYNSSEKNKQFLLNIARGKMSSIPNRKEEIYKQINLLPVEIQKEIENEKNVFINSSLVEDPYFSLTLSEKDFNSLQNEIQQNLSSNKIINCGLALNRSDGSMNPEKIIYETMPQEPDSNDYQNYLGRWTSTESAEEYAQKLDVFEQEMESINTLLEGKDDIREVPEIFFILQDKWIEYIGRDVENRSSEAFEFQEEYTDYYSQIGQSPALNSEHMMENITELWHPIVAEDPNAAYYAPEDIRSRMEDYGYIAAAWMTYWADHINEIDYGEAFDEIKNHGEDQEFAVENLKEALVMYWEDEGSIDLLEKDARKVYGLLFYDNPEEGEEVVENFVATQLNSEFEDIVEDLFDEARDEGSIFCNQILKTKSWPNALYRGIVNEPDVLLNENIMDSFFEFPEHIQIKIVRQLINKNFDFSKLNEADSTEIKKLHHDFQLIDQSNLVDIHKKREEINRLEEQNLHFNFYEKMKRNKIKMNDAGNVVPAEEEFDRENVVTTSFNLKKWRKI